MIIQPKPPTRFLKNPLQGFLFLTLYLFFFPYVVHGGIGDGLTDLEKKRVFNSLKKINVRLTEIETQNFKSMQESQNQLQETQRLILMQIQELQRIIPQMQGAIEQNRANLEERITVLTDEIQQIKFQGEEDRKQMHSDWKILHGKISGALETVRQGIATDIEILGKDNKQFLEKIQNANQETMQKIIDSINLQNIRLGETKKVITEQLIPTIGQQNQQNLKSFQTSLAKTESKSQSIIEILQKSFNTQKNVNESLEKNINTIKGNQKKANKNIITTGQTIDTLKDTLNQQLSTVSKNQSALTIRMDSNQKTISSNAKVLDDNTRKISERVKVLGSRFNNLGQSVNTLHANVAKLEEQNKNNIDKVIDKNQQILESFSGEKFSKLIKILEAQSLESETLRTKLDESGKNIYDNRNQVELANQKLTRLIEILKTIVSNQSELQQSFQPQVNRLSNEQTGIKNSLTDLKRKANVNISRNDDIKKAQKEIKKSLKKLLSGKGLQKP